MFIDWPNKPKQIEMTARERIDLIDNNLEFFYESYYFSAIARALTRSTYEHAAQKLAAIAQDAQRLGANDAIRLLNTVKKIAVLAAARTETATDAAERNAAEVAAMVCFWEYYRAALNAAETIRAVGEQFNQPKTVKKAEAIEKAAERLRGSNPIWKKPNQWIKLPKQWLMD